MVWLASCVALESTTFAVLSRDTGGCQAARQAAGLSGYWLRFSCRVTRFLHANRPRLLVVHENANAGWQARWGKGDVSTGRFLPVADFSSWSAQGAVLASLRACVRSMAGNAPRVILPGLAR